MAKSALPLGSSKQAPIPSVPASRADHTLTARDTKRSKQRDQSVPSQSSTLPALHFVTVRAALSEVTVALGLQYQKKKRNKGQKANEDLKDQIENLGWPSADAPEEEEGGGKQCSALFSRLARSRSPSPESRLLTVVVASGDEVEAEVGGRRVR